MHKKIIAIDQGTSSTRAVLFDENFSFISSEQEEFPQLFPRDGWVEHRPIDIWNSVLSVTKKLFSSCSLGPSDVISIGITNQRETTLIWDRKTGEEVYPAIVWQDRRTTSFCDNLREDSIEQEIHNKTGLLIDPYFSASKVAWILDNVPGVRARAERGELAFGTIDSFLIWKLTSGKEHKTDATNASRTSLFNIRENHWDDDLLRIFNIPRSLLPKVCDNASDFGSTSLFGGSISIGGVAGDQQSALIGQCCFNEGDVKSTFGTGCFVLVNTGKEILESKNRLLTTIAYRLSGETTYGLEGSVFVAGSALQWLRDKLRFFDVASDTESLAKIASDSSNVIMIPAFTGIGAPHWDSNARGAIYGLTRDSGIPEITLAALQSVVFQTKNLLDAMAEDGAQFKEIKVDGGMVNNSWFNQELANCLRVSINKPRYIETTSIGAAYLAGLQAGICSSLDHLKASWVCDQEFVPDPSKAHGASEAYIRWLKALDRTKGSI